MDHSCTTEMRTTGLKRLICIAIGVVLIYIVHVRYVLPSRETSSPERISTSTPPPITIDYQKVHQKVQKDRVARIHKACVYYKHLLKAPAYKKGTRRAVFFTSQTYDWSYCKIGKIVSTLWTKFFFILNHDGEEVQEVSTGARDHIHMSANKYLTYGVKPELFDSTRMVVSARNPYSRLFSAYIDRMFIPSLSVSVRGEDDPKCKTDITFSEFLMHAADNTEHGILEYHWSPIFHLCKPCEINPKFVFQQETVKDDFAYVINQTQLERYKLDALYGAMSIHSNWSTFALIEDVLDKYAKTNTRHSLDCQTQQEITVRLWEALQIQGIISDKAPFPYKRYESQDDYGNSDIFREALIDARTQYPLSTKEKDVQRQNAMNKFYKTVSRNAIERVLEVYGVDFDMFGYSRNPPPW